MKQMRPADPLGEFEQLVLLALLRVGDDAYGAELRREIGARTQRDVAISSVYVALDRLEKKGLVRTRVGEPTPERGGRRRKHVMLLPAGRRAVASVYRTFRNMVDGLEAELEKPR